MDKKLIYIMFLCGNLCFTACDKVDYTINSEDGPKTSEIIWFKTISAITVPADSASEINITVCTHKEADTAYSNIKFTTDKGFFNNMEKTINAKVNADKEVIVTLFGELEEGPAQIRAEVNGIAIDTMVFFEKSLPAFMRLSPSLLITEESSAGLDLELFRTTGRVGKNIQVDVFYQPLDTTGVQLDVPSFVIIADRKDSIHISNPLQWTGAFKIICKTYSASSDTISASATIIFQ
jgi:hypothetical protein